MEIKEQKDCVEINGEKLYFYIQRKKIKNMNLRVHKDKKVTISIPMRLSLEKAKSFVKSKASWIKKQQKFYDTHIEQKENEKIENGGKVYLLGEQYEVKIFTSKRNSIEIIDKFVEIYIKEKYIDDKKYISKTYNMWLKQYAMEILTAEVLKYQQQMKSTWGLCMPKRNKVKFNLNLIKTPIPCIEYVVVHELSHFKHPNHSKNFYNFVSIFMPDWKDRSKRLGGEMY